MTDEPLGFRNIGADGLRKFLQAHAEEDYELVDVRERDEYQESHLPGARLLPLSELEGRLNELREDKHTILYCGSGKRSERAALLIAQHRTIPNLYSLAGGVTAWDGETLPDFPNLHVFDTTGSVEQVVLRAMDLEKGAERMYEMLLGFFEASSVSDSMKKLLAAEEGHARLLYGLLKKVSSSPPDPFDELYGSMKGEVLESGETYEQVSKRVRDVPPEKRWALLELALDMEFSAYDLYRNLAAANPKTELEDVVLKLAAQEKFHYRMVLEALGVLASERAATKG